ncbi:MAG: hypothetical protein ACKV1O_28715 [Saprospiraceae bacterium]
MLNPYPCQKKIVEETEKTFDPDLRIVDANPTLRGAVLYFGGMGCFGVVMTYLLYYGFLWMAETFVQKFAWLAKISSFFLFLICLLLFSGTLLNMRDSVRNIRFSRQLRKKGIWTMGNVVGREKIDRTEDDTFYVFYQFRPDFVVRFHDDTNNLQFYKLSMGSEVKVCYLADNPEVSSLVF